MKNISWLLLKKALGISQNVKVVKDKGLSNYWWLNETKETWKLNAIHIPKLDSGP